MRLPIRRSPLGPGAVGVSASHFGGGVRIGTIISDGGVWYRGY